MPGHHHIRQHGQIHASKTRSPRRPAPLQPHPSPSAWHSGEILLLPPSALHTRRPPAHTADKPAAADNPVAVHNLAAAEVVAAGEPGPHPGPAGSPANSSHASAPDAASSARSEPSPAPTAPEPAPRHTSAPATSSPECKAHRDFSPDPAATSVPHPDPSLSAASSAHDQSDRRSFPVPEESSPFSLSSL